jgi:hypothetical protein
MDKAWVSAIFFLACALVLVTFAITRHLSAARQARAALTADGRYRGLTDEYRRLSDLAITAQEHTDLRLSDLSVQMDALRSQVDRLQHILRDVE